MRSEHTSAADHPALAPGEIHLWLARLDTGAIDAAGPVLSAEELQRRDRLRMPHLRRRFDACRTLLRRLIGRYLNCPARTVSFSYGAQGKPAVPGLEFNLSHSGDRMAVAFAREAPLGLDIEEIAPRLHARDIADRYFTPEERALLATPNDTLFRRRFFQLWTAKEAVMKATGLGFALDLHRIAIDLDPLRLANLDWDGPRDWTLTAVTPAPDCAGALAAPPGFTVRSFLLPQG